MNKIKEGYQIKIDGKDYNFNDPIVTGIQLLTAAGKFPVDEYLIFQLLKDGQFEEIRLDENADLTEPGLEHFKTFRSGESYRLTVDGVNSNII